MLTILGILLGTFAIGVWVKNEDLYFSAILGSAIWFITNTIVFVDHYHDVGTIRAGHHLVTVYEERKVELIGMIKDVVDVTKQDNLLLMNKDSPQSSLFTELASVSKDIAQAKRNIAYSKIEIEQRKLGFFGYIVSFFGEK